MMELYITQLLKYVKRTEKCRLEFAVEDYRYHCCIEF
jgi:hypothetical protein